VTVRKLVFDYFRKSKKHDAQDVDESIQDFMSTEEDKVAILDYF
jgi:hypothetical protein